MMHELKPGDPQLIGPYRLRGRLGTGGMGQVFLGRSAGGRPVAVKVIHAHLARDPEFRERFRREITVARSVSGMYTAPVIDADVDGPVPWLATAYVHGPSLADAISQHGPLPAAAVLALATGLAEGLAAIHAAGVVHRDLKPANVLLAEDGPHLIDFGISRATEASALTRTGLVVGSPGFMSTEQAEGGEVGPPSDIFSLGAVLAFAATGQGPFGTGSTPALVYRVVYSPPALDHLPAEVRPLIERCLAKDPAQRPAAAQLLAEAEAGWLPEPVTRTFSLDTAGVPPHAAPPHAAPPHAAPPHAAPTATAAVRPWPTRRQPGLSQPKRRRAWRPLAVTLIALGLLTGCTFTGVALTGSSGHNPGAGSPTMSPVTSAPPTTSAPASVSPTVTVSPSASASPTVTMSPSASASPTVTMSPSASASPTVTVSSSPSPSAPVTATASPTAITSPTVTITPGAITTSAVTTTGAP